MTIDEAIKHAEEVADKKKREKQKWDKWLESDYDHRAVAEKVSCELCAAEHRQLAEWLKELQVHREAWEKCIKEIKEWYWNADKQAIAKDPCVVDAMVDLFIRTIKEYRPKEGDAECPEKKRSRN